MPNTPDSVEDPKCAGYNPDQSDLVLTGEAEANFTGGPNRLTSYSSVYKTKRDALAAWTRSVKPALARCLAQFVKQGIEEAGGKAAIVRQGQIAFPKLAPRTVAYRVVANVSYTEAGKTTTVPLTLHVVALGAGRGDATLLTFAVGRDIRPPLLFAKLVANRLAAAKL